MHIIQNEIYLQAQLEEDVPMRLHERRVIYNPGYDHVDTTGPTITRYHSGEWHPGVRQQIRGNPYFAGWETTIGATHGPRLPVRDYTRFAAVSQGKPIRVWDMYNDYPFSVPQFTYVPNPSQLTPNSFTMNLQTAQSSGSVWRSW